MPKFSMPKKVFAAGLLVLAAGALGVGVWLSQVANAAPPDFPLSESSVNLHDTDWQKFYYAASSECSNCHVAPNAQRIQNGATDFVLLTESAIWRAFDKHAQAYAVLKGERGKQIGQILYGEPAKVLEPSAGCVSCHAMHNLSVINKAKGQPVLSLEDAVSCTGCHGPSMEIGGAPGWLGAHQVPAWRERSPKEKFHLGMRNLRDPVVRAELCASCHIGNAREGKVVTHPMMAAGHPPLPPMEVATFSKNEPQHWRDPENVPYLVSKKDDKKIAGYYDINQWPFVQTRAAMLGSLVAVRETFQLAHDRAQLNVSDTSKYALDRWPELDLPKVKGEQKKDRWPELAMAHSDCFACHHDLRYPGYRQARGFGYIVPGSADARVIPGRPPVRTWPLGSLTPALIYAGKVKDPQGLEAKLKELAGATSVRPFGDPNRIVTSSKALVDWTNKMIDDLHPEQFTRDKVLSMVHGLIKVYGAEGSTGYQPDYETARQIASILRVATTELKVGEAASGKVGEITGMLNTEPYFNRSKRLEIMKDVIWSAVNNNKPPAQIPPAFSKGFDDFKKHLKTLAGDQKFTKEDFNQLVDNDFLGQMGRKVTNEGFNTALIAKSDELQKLSDEEEKRVLEKIASYNPKTFAEKLRELDKLLP
jgi:Cytochrome c554 and c-prime